MDRDGTKAGFDLALTRAVADAVSIPVHPRAAARSSTSSRACARGMRERRPRRLDLPLRHLQHPRGGYGWRAAGLPVQLDA